MCVRPPQSIALTPQTPSNVSIVIISPLLFGRYINNVYICSMFHTP